MEVWCTGYTGEEGFDKFSTTSNGTVPCYGTVAVDSAVIPYGSIIYWPEYSNATPGNHYGIALDSGSAVIGSHLDWWYESNLEAARMTKTATVLILRRGWDEWLVDRQKWGL